MTGRIHFLMLVVNLFVAILLLGTNLVYLYFPGYFYAYLAQMDLALTAMNKSFFVIIHLSYLVWMFQVHAAINRLRDRYAVSAGDFLVHMLPVIHLWGIGAVFKQMRGVFAEHPLLHRSAVRLKNYVPLIYMGHLVSWIGYYAVHQSGGMRIEYVLLGVLAFIVAYLVFLFAVNLINQSVYVMVEQPVQYEPQESAPYTGVEPEPAWMRDRAGNQEQHHMQNHAQYHVQAVQWTAPAQPYIQPPGMQLELAGPGRRLAASMIDSCIFICTILAGVLLGAFMPGGDQDIYMALFVVLAILTYGILYAIHVSVKGRTLGKWMLGMRIVRAQTGQSGGFLYNYFLRSFVNYLIASFVPLYSLIDVCFIFTSDRCCLHDRLAGTIVIRERKAAATGRGLDETASINEGSAR